MSRQNTQSSSSTFVIAAGGTGGHFYPALSVAEAGWRRGHRMVFLVAGQRVDEHVELAQDRGFEAFPVPAPRLTRTPWMMLQFPWRFGHAWRTARRRVRQLSPTAVLGMGSFAAAPACAAAVSLRIPLVLHEGNTVLGAANRFFAPWAARIAVTLPLSKQPARKPRTVETGLPLRQELIDTAANVPAPFTAKTKYGLDPDQPVLLVFGGSQGASYLNELLPQVLRVMPEKARGFQVIHLTGRAETVESLVRIYARHDIAAIVRQYEEKMQDCYAAADLVLCRAGAATIAELALFGLPAVLVPLPSAAGNHQMANARLLANENAATVIPQGAEAVERGSECLKKWLDDMSTWNLQGQRLRRFAHPDAASRVVDLLESGKKPKQ